MLIAGAPADASFDEPWFNPPGGDWVPDQGVVASIKAELDANSDALAKYVDPTRPPAKYWFQYQGKGSGPNRTVVLLGFLYPISTGADLTLFDVAIPEACVISATYLPDKGKLTDLMLNGIKCPARI